MKTIVSILFLCLFLTVQGQGLLRYEPITPNYQQQQTRTQTSYVVRMTGYQYSVVNKKLTKIPIKIQITEGRYNDYYKFVAYMSGLYGWSQNFIGGGTPTINNVLQSDDLYEYFNYYVVTPIGNIYFNLD